MTPLIFLIAKSNKRYVTFTRKEQYRIRFGSKWTGKADITLLINGKPFMIVECKRPSVSQNAIIEGKEQLESYLNASRANLGIFANNDDPQKWTYYDNSIGFDEIGRSTFWKKIRAAFDTERDIEKEAQQLKSQRIEARAQKLVNANQENIRRRASVIIDKEAEKRVNEKSIRDTVAWRLQEKIRRLESELQEETSQLKSKINDLQTALEERRDSAMWGWVLFVISAFVISVILIIAVAGN